MTLYLDVSAGVNVQAGLGRYSRSLTRALLPYLETPPTLFYNQIRGRSQPIEGVAHCPSRVIPMGYKPWRLTVWMGQALRLNFQRLVPNASLFHAHEHLLLPLRDTPTVLTVHDLIFKLFPEHHKSLNHIFLNRAMPLFVKRADAIITISLASKRDLVTHYNVPPEKITVVYEAAAPDFAPPTPEAIARVRQHYQLPENYLLVVGTIEPRKNYSRLVTALMRLRERHIDLKLVVVGRKGWLYDEFFQTIRDLQAEEHVIFPGYVPDDDLPAVYGAATIAVMPSLYEGFGLPVLEAMACGTPVVSSDAASLPELGGEVARYFAPTDLEAMIDTLQSVLDDDTLRQEMSAAGPAQAARFSWDRTAQETLAVYNKLVDRPFSNSLP
ncbi:MAG: glycosyltransferase family 4 protein [Chloroflexi bacterium]|nr:glycosyltransferase family 4 protein [Chloroflexota bacterium]